MQLGMHRLDLGLAAREGPEIVEVVGRHGQAQDHRRREEPGEAPRIAPRDMGQQDQREDDGHGPAHDQDPRGQARQGEMEPGRVAADQQQQGRRQRQGGRTVLPERLAGDDPQVRTQGRGDRRRHATRPSPSPRRSRCRTTATKAAIAAAARLAIRRLSSHARIGWRSQPGLSRSSTATCGAISGTATSAGPIG